MKIDRFYAPKRSRRWQDLCAPLQVQVVLRLAKAICVHCRDSSKSALSSGRVTEARERAPSAPMLQQSSWRKTLETHQMRIKPVPWELAGRRTAHLEKKRRVEGEEAKDGNRTGRHHQHEAERADNLKGTYIFGRCMSLLWRWYVIMPWRLPGREGNKRWQEVLELDMELWAT